MKKWKGDVDTRTIFFIFSWKDMKMWMKKEEHMPKKQHTYQMIQAATSVVRHAVERLGPALQTGWESSSSIIKGARGAKRLFV